ncbi:DUF169 domain-containing protein [Deferrisoma palaeochoriense]
MRSVIAEKIGLRTEPVGIWWVPEAPEGAVGFRPGRWGCVMWLAAAAARGRTAAVARGRFGCFGGGVGLGFGDQYRNFPGGPECFCRFLSTGNASSPEGRAVAEGLRPHMRPEALDEFLEGERYLASPEVVRAFVARLPITDTGAGAVVFRPLSAVGEDEPPPEVVVFFADPDQVAALSVLANYRGPDNERVIAPFAAGCQAIGIYPYREARAEHPRAVLGLLDPSARLQVRRSLGERVLSFAMPYPLFRRMEADAPGSFLDRPVWRALRGE